MGGLFDKLHEAGLRIADTELDPRTTLTLADFLGDDDTLLGHLVEQHDIRSQRDVRRLAALDEDSWAEAIRASRSRRDRPADETVARHASALTRQMEERFPTEAFAARLARDEDAPVPRAESIARVLSEHPDFDLATGNVTRLFRERAGDYDDDAETKTALRTTQRVFKLAPRYDQAKALLARGVTSAASAQSLGRKRFVKTALETGEFTHDQALKAYDRAGALHAGSLILAGQLTSATTATNVAALSAAPAQLDKVVEDFPNLQSLFGQGDMCACEDCRSVHGAPAYVVDVLQFLKNRLVVDTTTAPAVTLKGAKDVLFGRRPDLGDTDLSCHNTNTPMPYLDLVCELLEEAVSPDPGVGYNGPVAVGVADPALVTLLQAEGWRFTPAAAVYGPDVDGAYVVRDERDVAKLSPVGGGWVVRRMRQTYGTAEEVGAAPEYVNDAAYAALAAEPSAFGLPFDLPHAETSGYFGQLDLHRADLMALLETGGAPTAAEIAADRLGLNAAAHALVVTPKPGDQDTIWDTPGAVAVLANVDAFVTRSGIDYPRLVELVDLPWVDGGQNLFIQHLDSSCDLAQKEIANLDADALDRIHRFERLRRATGWPAKTLDRAIRNPSVGNGTLDDVCLVNVAALVRLARRLRLKVDDLLDVLGPLATDDATYVRVFLSESAVGTIDAAFRPDAVAASEAAEAAVAGSGERLGDHLPYLALALGATESDVQVLVGIEGADPALTAATVGRVHARWRVAKAVKLKVPDFATLTALTAIDAVSTTRDLEAFADAAATVAKSGTGVPKLRYLLTHSAVDLAVYELPATAVTAVDDAFAAAAEATASPFVATATPAENAGAVRTQLGSLPGVAAADQATMQTLLDDAWTDAVTTEDAFVDAVLGPLFDTAAIKAALAARAAAPPAGKDAARNAAIKAVSDAVSAYLYLRARTTDAVAAVATALAASEETVALLANHAHLKQPAAAGSPLVLDVLLDDSGAAAATALKESAVRLLHTILLASAPYEPSDDLLAWLLDNAAALGWLEWDALPYDAGQVAAPFAAWASLQAFFGQVAAMPEITGAYDLVLGGAPAGDLLRLVADLAGLDADTLVAVDAQLGTSNPDLAAYRDPATLDRLLAVATILRQTGLDVATAVAVAKPALGPGDAAAMRAAVKTKYADTEWLGVLKQVQDGLRERKRDALVAYLLAKNPGLSSANDLYDWFLIDVEMAACMSTSRIVQAHATLQLFVQRCLMGLEPESVASVGADDGWKQWEWLANFRAWEANRKIFLYPENSIEPELRDDKSELFVKLDDTLQQNPMTDVAIEDATSAYLEGLGDIAHLDVMATYYETDRKTMHVFARTKGGDPRVYFHREFQQERYWTPWATVPIDITGDHLLAFDRNSRLTLAWPVFTEEPDTDKAPPDTPDPASLGGGKANDKAEKRWRIQLAVSERANGEWRPKKVSQGFLATDFSQSLPGLRDFNFFVWGLGKNQAVTCVGPNGLVGSFALTGCKGYPEPTSAGGYGSVLYPQFQDAELKAGRFAEMNLVAGDELAIIQLLGAVQSEILHKTPGNFEVTYPLQMSLVDWALMLLQTWALSHGGARMNSDERRRFAIPLGTLMPWFYGDYDRSYVVVPGFYERERESDGPRDGKTFSNVHQLLEDVIALATKYLKAYQQNPAKLPQLVQQLLHDPEYLRIQSEVRAYRKLRYGLDFRNFYHPLVCLLRSTLNAGGIPALMDRDLQLTDTGFDFNATYEPTGVVVEPYPREDLDFESWGAYSAYNWELFFHLPFDIAKRLSADQQFKLAREWYHYVFNPVGATDAPAPQRYWVTKPFFQMTAQDYLDQRIDSILDAVAADPSGATITDLAFAVSQWRDKPFSPHVVARFRPVAYQMAIVVAYVQNLVDWGDYLFRQFTRESVTQATQLYVLADKLLGPKPRVVPPTVPPPPMTYNQLEPDVDLFGNALLDLENLIPDLSLLPHQGAELPPPPATLTSLYFCIPPNSKLLDIYDLVDTRLNDIRHCRNIEGIETPLALFAPPIDPGALVKAVAGGLSVSSFVAGLGAPLPHYRFSVMSRKAADLASQVGAFGSELLTVLEKRDAEAMARLRSDHEINLLAAMREVKVATRAEAEGALAGLHKSKKVVEARAEFYAGQEFMNTGETVALGLNGVSLAGETAVSLGFILSSALTLIPQILGGASGFGGSPQVTVATSGALIGGAADSAAQMLSALTRVADKGAGMAATLAGYERRQQDWDHQEHLARLEIAALDEQIENAKRRIATIDEELTAHDLQVKNAKRERDTMHRKYTNQELYEWMTGQITSVYYKAYQLAFDVAKQAERCFGYELASDKTFVKFGYWNTAKKGLMAHHGLSADIARMEAAYLADNKREYELTKHISLAQLDPGALLRLKALGKTTIQIPETAFDVDYPSHYARRIKSVAMSLVCNSGPYTTVAATLSLVGNKYRKSTAERPGAANDLEKYAEVTGSDDRFAYNVGSIGSIATSTATSDSGTFELSFHDERYLPFEGAGAISTWQVELPRVFETVDRGTISDLVLHVRYTAREGGSAFKTLCENALVEMSNDMLLALGRKGWYAGVSLREQFPDEWWQLTSTGATQLTLGMEHLPFAVRAHAPAISEVTWVATVDGAPASYDVDIDGNAVTLNRDATMKTLCVGSVAGLAFDTPITVAANPAKLRDLTLLVHYVLTP